MLDAGCDSSARLDERGWLRAVVKVTGADGFEAIVALAEALQDHSERPVMLAWSRDGRPLSERQGPLPVILPDDRKPGRNVHQVRLL